MDGICTRDLISSVPKQSVIYFFQLMIIITAIFTVKECCCYHMYSQQRINCSLKLVKATKSKSHFCHKYSIWLRFNFGVQSSKHLKQSLLFDDMVAKFRLEILRFGRLRCVSTEIRLRPKVVGKIFLKWIALIQKSYSFSNITHRWTGISGPVPVQWRIKLNTSIFKVD